MKLVTYTSDGRTRVGAVHDDTVVDLSSLAPDMLSLIDGGAALLDRARAFVDGTAGERTPLSQVELQAPIPRPRKNIVCLGMNFAAHAYESLRAKGQPEKLPEYPVFFTKAVTTVNRPGGAVIYDPGLTDELDWEVELAFVVGRGGKNIQPGDAMNHIFGYTVMNDISYREIQYRHQQFFLGKSVDGSAPMGPWIVTADEIADPHALSLRLRVNGETMQDSPMDLIFDIPTIIATLSRSTTIEPGDIIATGTPSGVGMGMTPQRWLKPGDQIEAEIDAIGVLRSVVVG